MTMLATKSELLLFFRQDSRKVAITTIFIFDDAGGVLNKRGNIIMMAEEAHRTQDGDLAAKMRTAQIINRERIRKKLPLFFVGMSRIK